MGFSSSEVNSDCGFQLGNSTPQDMRTAIYGWHLRSKCVDPTPQDMRTAIYGWHLRSKCVDPTPQDMRTAIYGWHLRSKMC
ncbi:hypothetical protein [Anaerotignum lactatifermentans]|uniref:hypothetical protein n=1 Tax=Anaerotignum lactatifermentans TaxID=160404 RepID=UPI003AF18F71